MRSFKLPFTYTVNGEIEIQANCIESAINKFHALSLQASPTGHIPVLDKASKLVADLETFKVDEDEARDINPPIKYKVHITRTQTVEVEVEAHDEDEAEELATQKVHDGEVEEYFMDENLEVSEVEELED